MIGLIASKRETTMSFETKSTGMQGFLNAFSKSAFGKSITECQAEGVCVQCHKQAMLRTPVEVREYGISAMCGPCWDAMFEGEDDGES